MVHPNLSEDSPTVEEIAIRSLRERILDIIVLDEKFGCSFYLLQWLKAQNMDVERSEDMLRKACKWHQEQKQLRNFDMKTYLEFKTKYGCAYCLGKNGRPVAYYTMGAKDFKAALSKYGKMTWNQLWTKYMVELESLMFVYNKQKNRNTKRITYESTTEMIMIVDIKGFSARQLTSLDVNRIFKVVLAAVKPFMSQPYFTFEVYGDDKDWRNKILRFMDEDQLKKMLGQS